AATLAPNEDKLDEPGFALSAAAPIFPATTPAFSEPVADGPTLNAIQRKVDELGQDLDAVLNVLVESAQSLTRCAGAAIALGDRREMVCRASSGDAPPVSAHLQTGTGFSGECVRTARLLRCDDSRQDPIVDRASCEALGRRALIAAPILADGRVIGLLEVFSPNPYAFSESDSVALHRLAQVISRAVRQGLPALDLRSYSTSVEEIPIQPSESQYA